MTDHMLLRVRDVATGMDDLGELGSIWISEDAWPVFQA